MPVRMLFDSRQQYDGRAFRDCMHEAATHGVQIVRPQRGYHWTGDGVTLDILAPSLPILADAGESSEARLLASGTDLHADVLKVGHHGSQYASTPPFIAAVHPRTAIISVGRHNTFGHPGPSTLATLERAGATIFRTDRCGALSLPADSRTLPIIPSVAERRCPYNFHGSFAGVENG
jgi:beta-lactamase superfamily II metal-dependent hydrolase